MDHVNRIKAAIAESEAKFDAATKAFEARFKAAQQRGYELDEDDERPRQSDQYVGVSPADVVKVCDAIPIVERDQVARDIRKGCAAVLPKLVADPNRIVLILTTQAQHLLSKLPVPAPEPPSVAVAAPPAADGHTEAPVGTPALPME
jgi:hypothetical protein